MPIAVTDSPVLAELKVLQQQGVAILGPLAEIDLTTGKNGITLDALLTEAQTSQAANQTTLASLEKTLEALLGLEQTQLATVQNLLVEVQAIHALLSTALSPAQPAGFTIDLQTKP